MIPDQLIHDLKVAVTQAIDRVLTQHNAEVRERNEYWARQMGNVAEQPGRQFSDNSPGARVQEPQ